MKNTKEKTVVAYVHSKDGKVLDPMYSHPRVRHFIKNGKAVIVKRKPFTIRLTYDIENPIVHKGHLGQDTGRTNIGIAVILDDGKPIYMAELETNNKGVKKHMDDRRANRATSRRGERKRRQRRAIKNNTTFKDSKNRERILPKCEEPIVNNYIINTESKFANRKREEGWLTPTARHLLHTLIRTVEEAMECVPIADITIEVTKWDFEKLNNPNIKNWEYGKGKLYGFESKYDAVNARQEGKCLLCGGKIEHYHHVMPKHENGSDTVDNLAGLCEHCHSEVHIKPSVKKKLSSVHKGLVKQYAAQSVMNQIMPYYIDCLIDKYENVYITDGRATARLRKQLSLSKTHAIDAWCIAASRIDVSEMSEEVLTMVAESEPYMLKQFRRQNRANINNQRERTYKLEGKVVAKNRKARFEQKEDSLEDWFNKQVQTLGEKAAEKLRSNLTVTKSTRYYNTPGRVMPGATFLYEGKRYVLSGQLANGTYYRAVNCGNKNFPSRDCQLITHNNGLVYL